MRSDRLLSDSFSGQTYQIHFPRDRQPLQFRGEHAGHLLGVAMIDDYQ